MSAIVILLIIFVVILGIYIWCASSSSNIIIKSKLVSATGITEGDMVYYLPTANLQINVTATILIVSSKDEKKSDIIDSARLTALSFQTVPEIVPDTNKALAMNYNPSIFMSDEIRLTTNSSGLLDTIITTTEDKLSGIISQVADAPGKILTLATPYVMNALPGFNIEKTQSTKTMNYPNTFYIPSAEIQKKKISFPWIINIDGTSNATTNVDASFDVDIVPLNQTAHGVVAAAADIPGSVNGVLTRLLHTVRLTISSKTLPKDGGPAATNDVQIPDISRLINIPITRSLFVKKVNTPKFSNGLIVENYINKPSEAEGFVSIPINIGKALVSIPAQLFNFKIHHKYDGQIADLTLQNKIAELEKQLNGDPGGNEKPPSYQ